MASDRLSSLNILAVSSLPLSQVIMLKSALSFTTYLVAQTDWYYQHTGPVFVQSACTTCQYTTGIAALPSAADSQMCFAEI